MPKAALILSCLIAASGLCALEFDVSRAAAAEAESDAILEEEPTFELKAPWGLWANRAPYPYYDGPFGIDTVDDLVARDIWFDFQSELFLGVNEWRGLAGQMRFRAGLFHADVSYLQLARTDGNGLLGHHIVRDWAGITDARGHLGFSVPLPYVGYIDASIGLAGFDETRGISRLGVSFKASASIYPIWPIELEGWISRAQFFDGTGVNEFGGRMHVQVFRHLHLTAGWRWLNVDGTDTTTHGFTFGFSFQWANLRTFFWEPFRGPAY